MTDLSQRIAEAALRVFMRYGVKRATMADIAAEAGIVRQTLYKVFASKDAILCATIRHYAALSLADIEAGWEQEETLDSKLSLYLSKAVTASFEMINAGPDARDMIGGFNAAGQAAVQSAGAQKTAALARMLATHEQALAANGLSAEGLADYIHTASMGIRDTARDSAHLAASLAIFRQSILKLAGA